MILNIISLISKDITIMHRTVVLYGTEQAVVIPDQVLLETDWFLKITSGL
jgi:hypothetical protein